MRYGGQFFDGDGDPLIVRGDKLTLVYEHADQDWCELATVEVVSVERETALRLLANRDYATEEIAKEGHPGMDPGEFVKRFIVDPFCIPVDSYVARIEWRYL